MVNKNRDYGLDWERELVKFFKELDSNCVRMPNSGAYGTVANIASLTGDLRFDLDGLHFLVEAKAGYGGSKSITFQRDWMDKVLQEAGNNRPTRIPLVALKMRGAKGDSGKLIVLTLANFKILLDKYADLLTDLTKANDFIFSLKDSGVDISGYIKG
jgi:Holliday junction resolvase